MIKGIRSPNRRKSRALLCGVVALYLALTVSAYAMLRRMPGGGSAFRVYGAFFRALNLHWVLVTGYLFCVYWNDQAYHHAYVMVRAVSRRELYAARLAAMAKTAAGLWGAVAAGFLLLALAAGEWESLRAVGALPTALGFFDLLLGLLVIGAGCVALTARAHESGKRTALFLLLYLVISIDFMSVSGYLWQETNLVYAQALSLSAYFNGQPFSVLLTGAGALLAKLAVLAALGYWLSGPLRPKGGRHAHKC